MRAIVLPRAGAPDVLRVEERPQPKPGPGEVAIAVRAAGINFADILARQGIYPDCPPMPCVLGYEVAGTVTATGEGADPALRGREVMALTDFGGYAEVAVVGADYVWDKPAGLSFEQAAAIPLNYLTAWGLLVTMGGIAGGDTVLLHNAGGGVGLAALDIAVHRGATVIGTASARKHEFLKSRGCAHCIDYTQGDWTRAVMDLTGGKGVEVALDPIGGPSWRQSYSVLRATGRAGFFGISGAASGGWRARRDFLGLFLRAPFFHPARFIPGNKGVYGINIHNMYGESGKFRRWMSGILDGIAAGWARPHVDRSFAFADAAAAHAHIEARGNIGKVLLLP